MATATAIPAAIATMRFGPSHHSSGLIRCGASSTPSRGGCAWVHGRPASGAVASHTEARPNAQTQAAVAAAPAAIGAA